MSYSNKTNLGKRLFTERPGDILNFSIRVHVMKILLNPMMLRNVKIISTLYIQQNKNLTKYNASKIGYTSITNKAFTMDIYKLLFWSQIVDVALKWSSAL